MGLFVSSGYRPENLKRRYGMYAKTGLMSRKNNPVQGGLRHVKAIDSDEELLKAYSDFAFYHTRNAAELYEYAAALVQSRDQKVLFLQLACRKKDVLHKLMMGRSETHLRAEAAKNGGLGPFPRFLRDAGLSLRTTLKEAFSFAYNKEAATLALYEKMANAANLFSIKMLFDYLIESERQHVVYLDSQLSITNGDLDRPAIADVELEYASA